MRSGWRIRGAIGAVLAGVALLSAVPAVAAPPPNDAFANAVVLSGEPAEAIGTTKEATVEPGEPSHGGGGHSVWYSWQAPGSEWVTAYTCGGASHNTTAVYTGETLAGLTKIASSAAEQGFGCGFNPADQASFRTSAGTVYRIAVDGEQGATGPIQVVVASTSQPAYDYFSSPQWMGGANAAGEGVTVGATQEPGEVVPAGWGGATIWFAWTAPEDGAATLSTCGSDYDAQVAAYAGDSVAALTPVGRMTSGYPWLCESRPMLVFGVSAGDSYRFAVDGKAIPATGQVETGNVWLRLNLGIGYPQNDAFSNPLGAPWSGDTAEFTGTSDATKQLGEPAHAGDLGGASVWFKWTAPEAGTARFATCGSSFDTLLAIYTGSSVRALTPVAANDDSSGPRCSQTSASEVSFRAVAGTEYRIAVDGAGGTGGRLMLSNGFARDLPRKPLDTYLRRLRIVPARHLAWAYFRGSEPGLHFRCQIDRRRWRSCRSPAKLTGLRTGRHVFRVAAIDGSGNRDPSPRVKPFRIDPS